MHIVHVVLLLTVTTLLPTLQVHYLPMWCVGLPNIFCQNHSTFTHFSIITILRLFLNKNISPLRRRTPSPPVSRRKSRSKKLFTYLSDISTEIYELRKLIVMDIPITEVLSLSRGDTALGEDFFFGGSGDFSPNIPSKRGQGCCYSPAGRSERLVKVVRTNSKFAFSSVVCIFIIFKDINPKSVGVLDGRRR